MKMIKYAALLLMLSVNVNASEFCDGFEEGYRTVKGSVGMIPMCPMPPMTPMGSTPYREGIRAGIRAARRG